jgi:hypothetical protein
LHKEQQDPDDGGNGEPRCAVTKEELDHDEWRILPILRVQCAPQASAYSNGQPHSLHTLDPARLR